MAIRSQAENEKPPVSLTVIIASAVLLLLVVGGLAWYFLGSPTSAGTVSKDPNAVWIRQKAVESQGDITKLTPDDQQKLVKILGAQRAMTELKTQYSLQQSGN